MQQGTFSRTSQLSKLVNQMGNYMRTILNVSRLEWFEIQLSDIQVPAWLLTIVLLYFNALDWTKSCICIQCNTHTLTHTKLTCPDWVFTALKQVVGSKQQLPQKQNSKAKKASNAWKMPNNSNMLENVQEMHLYTVWVTWKETFLLWWNKSAKPLWFCKCSCTQMMAALQAG